MAAKTVTSPVLAWYFLPSDRKLPYPPHTEVKPGLKLVHEGTLAFSGPGLQASIRALDALYNALGPIVCRVEMAGAILHDANQRGANRLVARECTCLWLADASNVLHEFVCQWAEQALLKEREAGREPDARSWKAIDAKRAWLAGKADDRELAAAAAARDVASAAWADDASAAWDVTWAAWAAWADDASAAWDVTWAAWAARRLDAAWAAQNSQLEVVLNGLHSLD